MKKMMLALCLVIVGCGYSNSNLRSRTVTETDDGSTLKREVVTQEVEADAVSLGLPPGAGYGYGPGYGSYGYGYDNYGPYGGRVVMGRRPPVQLDTPIVTSTTTVVTGGTAPGGSPAKDAEQDQRLDRVERRTQDLRDVELRQECEKPENKDKQVCRDLNAKQGGK